MSEMRQTAAGLGIEKSELPSVLHMLRRNMHPRSCDSRLVGLRVNFSRFSLPKTIRLCANLKSIGGQWQGVILQH